MSNQTTTQTVRMTIEQKRKLRQLALAFGFTIGRGKNPRWGSVRQLILAIADGKLDIQWGNGEHG